MGFLEFFPDVSRFFFSGLGWTGELWSNRIVLILRNKEDFFLLKKILGILSFGGGY